MNNTTEVLYLSSESGTSIEGGSSLSGYRIETLLRKRYKNVSIVTDSWKYNPFNSRNIFFLKYKIIVTYKPKQILKFIIISILNIFKKKHFEFNANNKDVIVITNSFSFIPERINIINYRSLKKVCIIRGDVNSFDYQPYSDGGIIGDLSGPIKFLNNQDSIIYVSKTIRKNWENEGIDKEKSYYLPNSINESKPTHESKDSAAKFCGFRADEFNIVVVGTIQFRKGQDIFIKLVKRLYSYKNIKIHFIGNIAPKFGGEKIIRKLRKYKDIFIFHGHKNNALDYIHAADLCLLTSRSEAFPRTIAEYMFYGKPIITSRVAGADEMIVDGKSGFLFDINNHEELMKKINFIYCNYKDAKLLGSNAKKRYDDKYSAERQEKTFFEILDSLEI